MQLAPRLYTSELTTFFLLSFSFNIGRGKEKCHEAVVYRENAICARQCHNRLWIRIA